MVWQIAISQLASRVVGGRGWVWQILPLYRYTTWLRWWEHGPSCGWDLADCGWDLAELWMRSSRVVDEIWPTVDEVWPSCGWDMADCGWGLAELWMRYGRLWMRSGRVVDEIWPTVDELWPSCGWDLADCGWDLAEFWMRSGRVVRASDSQCRSRNCPGFDPSILRHSGIWGAADESALNIVHKKEKKAYEAWFPRQGLKIWPLV